MREIRSGFSASHEVIQVTELNLRFLVSSIGSVFANASALGANIYNIFCVGMEAYACIEQDGYSASFIDKYVNVKSSLIDLKTVVANS